MDYGILLAVAVAVWVFGPQSISGRSEADVIFNQFKALYECEQENGRLDSPNETGCSLNFDGWSCWKPSPAESVVQLPCPHFLPGNVNESGIVTLRCLRTGRWESQQGNYSSCTVASLPPVNVSWLRDILKTTRTGWDKSTPVEDREKVAKDFENCFYELLTSPLPKLDPSAYCRRTFDGWGCWNDTIAGQTAYIPCPDKPGFHKSRKAHKICGANGEWFRHPETNQIWSNYTACVDTEDLEFRNKVNAVYIGGYSVSLVALLLSLTIFFYFRSLRCRRITIHKNLFLSFVINNLAWIIWYLEVIAKSEVIQENDVPCQVLHVVTQYFLVSNYFWMFCEGLYLHTLLVLAFVSEEKIMKWFYLIGWGLPVIPITAYAVARGMDQEHSRMCWMEHDTPYIYILSVPVCLSILVSFAFLVNIVRVLVTKLRAVNSPDTDRTRKAVRATVILLPLLGLHYVVTPFRPEKGSPATVPYEIVSAVVTSFQGLCVALLFCFFNGEVTALLKKRWSQASCIRYDDRRMSYANTSITYLPRRISEGKSRSPSVSPNHQHHQQQQQTLL